MPPCRRAAGSTASAGARAKEPARPSAPRPAGAPEDGRAVGSESWFPAKARDLILHTDHPPNLEVVGDADSVTAKKQAFVKIVSQVGDTAGVNNHIQVAIGESGQQATQGPVQEEHDDHDAGER